jgi:hypothetical protein
MLPQNPNILLLISFLNPVIIADEMMITAMLKARPAIAIPMITFVKDFVFAKARRLAIK